MSDLLDPSTLLALAVILLVCFPIHETAHAWVAYRLGDDTAKRQGRLTLNPLAHLDLFGTLIMILSRRFGWAKPVPVAPWRLRYGPRVGGALVAAAGPFSNLLMAAGVSIVWRLGLLKDVPEALQWAAALLVVINVGLFIFNLIPLAPLDGFSVLMGVVGRDLARTLQPLGTYGPYILMGLFMLEYISPSLDILGRVMSASMDGVLRLLLGY